MHSHLLELTDKHAKCIAPLLKYLTSTRNDTDIVTSWCPCMAEGTYTDRMNGVHAWLRAPSIGALSHAWTPFILSLAATSPVCALVHCADQMKSLLTMMITEECDVKKTPAHMILYTSTLCSSVIQFDKESWLLSTPFASSYFAEALFSGQQVVHDEKSSISSVDELHHLGFFPQRIVQVTQ